MKCMPSYKISEAHGNVLHDCHAETIAFRAFNRFLIEECAASHSSKYIRARNEDMQTPTEYQPFEVRDNVGIHLYCSEAPCGDASMELTMGVQDDATPWEARPWSTDDDHKGKHLLGRGYFSELGVVRRKPCRTRILHAVIASLCHTARSDAPATLSKSCTDKLTLKQFTSTLSSLTSILLHPRNAYLSSIILPASQHIPKATTRAFRPMGRLKPIKRDRTWPGGYRFCPFSIEMTTREFAYSRRSATKGQRLVPSNLSLVWSLAWQETLVGGAVQGIKAGNAKGASKISRREMWKVSERTVAASAHQFLAKAVLSGGTYGILKDCEMLGDRARVKDDLKREVLKGWTKNAGDDDFEL